MSTSPINFLHFGYHGIDLSSNFFEGLIPLIPSNVTSLLLSKNTFLEKISFVCEIIGLCLSYLDLSNDWLPGQLPNYTMYWQKLIILNLANNNFSIKLPSNIDSDCTVRSLGLYNDNFSREWLSFLKNCKQLPVLSL